MGLRSPVPYFIALILNLEIKDTYSLYNMIFKQIKLFPSMLNIRNSGMFYNKKNNKKTLVLLDLFKHDIIQSFVGKKF